MTDLPPADWYTDPEDESQYRYWDGSAWTEHRAPRHADPEGGAGSRASGIRGSVELVSNTFSTIGRQWRGCAAAALISLASELVLIVLGVLAVDRILMGELGEIWDRINDPDGFDPTTPENEAYFESLEFDLSPDNLALIGLALLVIWAAGSLVQAAVTRLTVSDLRGRSESVSDGLRQSLPRIPRLMGVDLQLLALFAVALGVTVVLGVLVPLLLILLIPAFIVLCVVAFAVVPIAYAVASVGPTVPSLREGLRLVRGRFWAVLGRMLLVYVVIIAVLLPLTFGFTLAAAEAGTLLYWASQAIMSVVSAAAGVLVVVAPAIIYLDLGGEAD